MTVLLKGKRISYLATAGLWLAASIWPRGKTVADESESVALEQMGLLQVQVQELIIDPASMQPVVILADSGEQRGLFIWIDHFEANAIHSEMKGIKHIRPLTHDLLETVMHKAHLKIRQVVITHIQESIYYARILMEDGGALTEIDSRPSDSIVMALKFRAPIYVSKTLFEEAAMPLRKRKEIEERYGLTIQELTPSLAQAFSFTSTRGVLVSDVRKGSQAEKDGLERGDIFVELGGRVIKDFISIRNALQSRETQLEAKIFRRSHFITITLHPN